MIRLWTEDTLPKLSPNWQGTYVLSRFAAYGTNARFAPFYADEKGNFLSVLDGNAVLSGTDIHVEEWAAFVAMQPEIRIFSADGTIAKRIAELLQKPILSKRVMRLEHPLPTPSEPLIAPTPRQMYPLLTLVFGNTMPPFESWYVDVSHRVRHGICKTAGIERDGALVSTAMTVAESAEAAIIGAVATAPNYRKQGMASRCLQGLAAAIYAENAQKTIMISPKNSGAEKLYADMGFAVCGEIGQIQIRE